MDEKELILGQYQAYSLAKEKYIDRHFKTNRFYLVMTLVILLVTYLFVALTPDQLPILFSTGFGMVVTILWWLNIDTYQFWIKIKYSKVLEYLETKLPEQPYKKEFDESLEIKRKQKVFVFTDFQKSFTVVLFLVNLISFAYYLIAFLNQPKGL